MFVFHLAALWHNRKLPKDTIRAYRIFGCYPSTVAFVKLVLGYLLQRCFDANAQSHTHIPDFLLCV